MDQNPETQTIESLLLNEWQIKFFPFFHSYIHRCSKAWATTRSVWRDYVNILTPENTSGIVVTNSLPQCQISWPTSMAALSGIPARPGIGVIIDGSTDGTIRIAKCIGRQDNNVAEYVALLEALQCALGLKAEALHVFSDSEVVVKQMVGDYTCRSPRLYSLNWTCRKLAQFLDFSISHVRRENNTEANALANSAVRKRL